MTNQRKFEKWKIESGGTKRVADWIATNCVDMTPEESLQKAYEDCPITRSEVRSLVARSTRKFRAAMDQVKKEEDNPPKGETEPISEVPLPVVAAPKRGYLESLFVGKWRPLATDAAAGGLPKKK